jgi:hypothetical protein
MYFLVPESTKRLQLVMFFFIGDAQLRASSSYASPNNFLIGARRQKLPVPRAQPLLGLP